MIQKDRGLFLRFGMLLYKCILNPMFLYRSRWNTNKHFRGSWTYYKMKEATDDDVFIEDLAEPIGELKPVSNIFVNFVCRKKVFQ